jgi:hypothetical protein
MLNPELESPELANHLAHFSQDQELGDSEESDATKELDFEDEFLAFVAELGYTESEIMRTTRQTFAQEIPADFATMHVAVNTYLEAGEQLTNRDSDSKTRLALNMLLVLFYSPCQTEDIENEFDAAMVTVLDQVYGQYPELVETVNAFFDKVGL